ncbi:MAG: hypothetical protein KAJ29_04950 [Alphaproteobacteria bacterium]|nr:hypothetical protein [Alphaproteobacteria bacterium]
MTSEISTIDNVKIDIERWDNDYSYQEQLTKKLDAHSGEFNQEVINEIVLWKINRYAATENNGVLSKINRIKKTDTKEDTTLTKEILEDLLNIKGFGLPMATTVLRFKNPNIYQLIDQRVYKFIFGKPMPTSTRTDKLIQIYRDYLDTIRELCDQHGIEFSKADRILYQADIIENKGVKLTGYGR